MKVMKLCHSCHIASVPFFLTRRVSFFLIQDDVDKQVHISLSKFSEILCHKNRLFIVQYSRLQLLSEDK